MLQFLSDLKSVKAPPNELVVAFDGWEVEDSDKLASRRSDVCAIATIIDVGIATDDERKAAHAAFKPGMRVAIHRFNASPNRARIGTCGLKDIIAIIE